MMAKASPVVLTVSTSGGDWVSCTSASTTDRTTGLPANGIPRAWRTVLCTPVGACHEACPHHPVGLTVLPDLHLHPVRHPEANGLEL